MSGRAVARGPPWGRGPWGHCCSRSNSTGVDCGSYSSLQGETRREIVKK